MDGSNDVREYRPEAAAIPAGSWAGGELGSGGAAPAALRPRFPKRPAKGRDLGLAAVLLGFCFLLWDCLFWASGLGLGEGLALAALLPAALIYLRDRAGRMTVYGWVCAGLYLLGAASLALSGDWELKFYTVWALIPLFITVLLERLGLRTGTGLQARLSDCFCLGGASVTRLNEGCWALTHSGSEDGRRRRRGRALLAGVLCAIPALMLVVPLLIRSDAAFEGLVGKLDLVMLRRSFVTLSFALVTALMCFTLLFTSDRGPKPLREQARKGVEPLAAAAFLGVIAAVYLLYLAAQFAYFTDAFRGLLPKGYTVAEYARRGFFEMCTIVLFNLALIVGGPVLCRKDGGRVPGPVKGLTLFLCGFSLALVATAMAKMVLYMQSFGLTRLRVLTSAFMVFLAVIVVLCGLYLFRRRAPLLQLALTLGAAMLIALSLANVDGRVARYNVDAWRSGRLEGLDVQMLTTLGDGATPVLAELAREPDPEIAAPARDALRSRSANEPDWRSWNMVGAAARAALE